MKRKQYSIGGAGDGHSVYLFIEGNPDHIAVFKDHKEAVAACTVLNTRSFIDLQHEQRAWVEHNFPQQLGDVTAEEVSKAISHYRVDTYEAVAMAINDGRLGKKKHHGFLGAVEEIGELAHAYLKGEQGIREGADGWRERAADAVADAIIFLASFCNTHGIIMQHAVDDAWGEVSQRDWIKFPKDGRTE